MAGQMAVLLQGHACSQVPVSLFSRGGHQGRQLLSPRSSSLGDAPVRFSCRNRPVVISYGAQAQMAFRPRKHGGIERQNWGRASPSKRCRERSVLKSLATESSGPEEDPRNSADDEDDQPMRDSGGFMGRVLRQFVRLLKAFSPLNLTRGAVAFLGRRGRRVSLLWAILGCTFGLVYLSGLMGGATPQVVPYSELVRHLQSKTVTSALFEEGSSHLYFNLDLNEVDKSKEVGKSASPVNEELVAAGMATAEGGMAGVSREGSSGVASSSSSKGDLGQSNAGARATTSRRPVKSGSSSRWAYSTRRIRNDESFLLPLMRDGGVKYSSAPQSMGASLRAVLITVVTLWIPLSPLLWLLHRQMSGNSGGGKKKQRVSRLVKFTDVAGVDVAKAELMEIVECMKGAPKFVSLGAKLPRGVLLVGPPGTGKTLLARAVAGEAGVPFYAASASEFVEMFVGRGAARVRELFSEARKHTPSIVFIDELDAVGGRRGRSFNDERDQTLNQLLTEMDGFETDSGVLVLAATNRPEALDPALCRPGRLSRRVHVTEPDFQGRQQVLAVHMRGIPVADDPVVLRRMVASITGGFVGADLANLVNEATLLAARKGQGAVVFEDFKEAVNRVKYGVGERRFNVFVAMEQRIGTWLGNVFPETGRPAASSSG